MQLYVYCRTGSCGGGGGSDCQPLFAIVVPESDGALSQNNKIALYRGSLVKIMKGAPFHAYNVPLCKYPLSSLAMEKCLLLLYIYLLF